jgi:tRNA A-37 threonylcarbamoyl transferase component Bud32/tetratricopeptide (TPR) repeat protein
LAQVGGDREGRAFARFLVSGVLGSGSVGVVYRAVDVETGRPVAVKTVRVKTAQVPVQDRLWSIRREIHTLGRLRHPGVVQIVAEGVEAGVPWYAMELLEGETLRSRIERAWGAGGSRCSAADQSGLLNLVARMAAALAFVHGEGIVHGDLKPENVFLRDGDQPVLMDFGVAWRTPTTEGREVLDDLAGLAGTVEYLAPELLHGEPIDARADLYALGCIFFELLTGRPPFVGADAAQVLMQHLSEPPPLPSTLTPGVPRALDDLVVGLLAKRPRDRIQQAEDVITELERLGAVERPASRRTSASPPPYRPTLLGREWVLSELVAAARRTVAGKGACILLGGESGIGKTYVAAELGRRAGPLLHVATGSCIPAGNQRRAYPLQPLRPLLQTIADHCVEHGPDATDRILGPRGRTLAFYEPALEGLPGQECHPAPSTLTGPGARDHLLACLTDTLAAFGAERPFLLILDDLHWADELTLRFLTTLPEGWIARQPILIVATYRTDEAPEELDLLRCRSDVAAHDLAGLHAEHVAALVSDMLGVDATPMALSRFLARQSQGNPFFVTEYVRTALDEGVLRRTSAHTLVLGSEGSALSIDRLESLPLPRTVRDLVARRLDRLGALARHVVETASVLGREFDGQLLRATSGLTDPELMDVLTELLRRQVMEEAAGRWRFVHDSLSDIAYRQIADERRRALHEAAARALEVRGGEDYAALAHHWSAAENDEEALHYLEKAGFRAFRAAAYSDAATFLRHALDVDERRLRSGGGGVGAARRAQWECLVGRAEHGLGDLVAAELHGARALRVLGHRVPSSTSGWIMLLLGQALAHVAKRAGLRRLTPPDRALALQRAAEAATLLMHCYFYVDNAPALLASALRAVNLAERGGVPEFVPRGYVGVAYLCGMLRCHRLAARYFRTAHAGAAMLNDRGEAAYCLAAESVYHGTFGDWAAAEAAVREGEERLRGVVDPFLHEMVLTTMGHVEYFTGCFSRALERYEAVLRSARARHNMQTTAWGLFSMARSLVALGRFAEARPLLEEASTILDGRPELQSEIICLGLLAVVRLRLGDDVAARSLADQVLERIRRARPAGYPAVVGYAAVVDVYRTLEPQGRSVERAERALRSFARVLPMAGPVALLRRGELARERGRVRLACRALRRSLTLATRFRMPLDEALAHLALADVGPAERRGAHLRDARERFAAMDCAYHLGLVATLEARATA